MSVPSSLLHFHGYFIKHLTHYSYIVLAILLSACNSGSDSSSDTIAGIDGTGDRRTSVTAIGVTTKVSEERIEINNVEYNLNQAQILIDGEPATSVDIKEGQVLTVFASKNETSTDILDVTNVVHNTHVFGAVTEVNPSSIVVLGQSIEVTPGTRISGYNTTEFNQVRVGDAIQVSGFTLSNGEFSASLLHRITKTIEQPYGENGIPLLEINGVIKNLDRQNTTFHINDLVVDFSTVSDLPELANGLQVEALGNALNAENALQLTEVNATSTNLGPESSLITIESVITNIIDDDTFKIDNIDVELAATTSFLNGTRDNLQQDNRIIINGTVRSDGSILADSIQFLDAFLTSHKTGDVLSNEKAVFTWTDSQADRYQLVIESGNQLIHSGYYDSQTFSTIVDDLPVNGAELSVSLRSIRGRLWTSTLYSLTSTTATTLQNAELLNKQSGEQFTASTVYFEWTDVQADEYQLIIQSDGTRSVNQFFDAQQTSVTIQDLPANEARLRVFLNTRHGSGWFNRTYNFTSQAQLENARLTSHNSLDVLQASATEFTWENVNADEYRIIVKSVRNNTTHYDQFFSADTKNVLVQNLPQDGEQLYLLLKTRHGTGWHTNTYTFNTQLVNDSAVLISHDNKIRIEQDNARFIWSDVNADAYKVVINSGDTVFLSQQLSSDTVFIDVEDLPINGKPLFLDLYTLHGDHWTVRHYEFTTLAGLNPARLISHQSGDQLVETNVFSWQDVNADEYRLTVFRENTIIHDANYSANIFSAEISTLPTDGLPIFLTLASRFDNGWLEENYSFDTVTALQSSKLLSHQTGDTLQNSTTIFSWTNSGADEYQLTLASNGQTFFDEMFTGDIVSTNVNNLPTNGVIIDVLLKTRHGDQWLSEQYSLSTDSLLENSVLTSHVSGESWQSNSVLFTWKDVNADQYQLIIDSDGTRSVNHFYSGTTLSAQIDNLPQNAARMALILRTRHGSGWASETYKFNAYSALDNSELISHDNGDELIASSQTFNWSDVKADEYRIIVKTDSAGVHDQFYDGNTVSATIDMPTGQSQLLLKTRHGNGWFTRVYSFNTN